jgi:hypothetical protein
MWTSNEMNCAIWASHLERAQIAALVVEAREINDGLRALFLNMGGAIISEWGRNHSVTGGDIIQELGGGFLRKQHAVTFSRRSATNLACWHAESGFQALSSGHG